MPAPTTAEIEAQEENPAFTCSACGAPVVMHDGRPFKTCNCGADVGVIANMRATVRAIGGLQQND